MRNKIHIGIIPDGNRRWAKERGLSSIDGHSKGMEVIQKIAIYAKERGIGTITFFAFSTENWNRKEKEVSYLMSLIERFYIEKNKIIFDNFKIKIVGERDNLSERTIKSIEGIENDTKDNKGILLNIAFNYGGKREIVSLIKEIVKEKTPNKEIDEFLIDKKLSVSDIDLIIRTGKEKRISNFFIWQSAYSELYFSDKYWPEFTEKDLENILNDFKNRKRRFGR